MAGPQARPLLASVAEAMLLECSAATQGRLSDGVMHITFLSKWVFRPLLKAGIVGMRILEIFSLGVAARHWVTLSGENRVATSGFARERSFCWAQVLRLSPGLRLILLPGPLWLLRLSKKHPCQKLLEEKGILKPLRETWKREKTELQKN